MKCDELEAEQWLDYSGEPMPCYPKVKVDAAIAELKAAHHKERHEYINMIAELKAEINRKEAVEQRWFERCMEARTENIRLKRALWLARANRALEKIAWFKLWNTSISTMNPEDGTRQEYDKWKKNLGKFIKKEEEYK